MLGVKFVPVIVTVPPPMRTVFGEAFSVGVPVGVGHGFGVGLGVGRGVGFGVGLAVGFGVGLEVGSGLGYTVEPGVEVGVGVDPGLGLFPGAGVVPGLPVPEGAGLVDGVGLGRVPGATIRSGSCRGQDPLQHNLTWCMPVVSSKGMTIPWLTAPLSSA